jgi:hypothetical protein
MFNHASKGCRFGLSSLALERSVGGGRSDQSSWGFAIRKAFSTVRVFHMASSNSISSFLSSCPRTC